MVVIMTESEQRQPIQKSLAMKSDVIRIPETEKPTIPTIQRNLVQVTKHQAHDVPPDLQRNRYQVLPAEALYHLFPAITHQAEFVQAQHEAVVQVSARVVHQDRVQAEEHVQVQAVEPAQVPVAQVIREDANLVYLASAL